jgi:hypothetical protein
MAGVQWQAKAEIYQAGSVFARLRIVDRAPQVNGE